MDKRTGWIIAEHPSPRLAPGRRVIEVTLPSRPFTLPTPIRLEGEGPLASDVVIEDRG